MTANDFKSTLREKTTPAQIFQVVAKAGCQFWVKKEFVVSNTKRNSPSALFGIHALKTGHQVAGLVPMFSVANK